MLTAEIKVNPVYLPYLNNRSRNLFIYGSSGSGKSVFAAQKLVIRALQHKQRFLCVRKTHTSIKESVYKLLESVISELPIKVIQNKSDLGYKFANGSEILTAGLDNVNKLKSITDIDGIWIEEADETELYDYKQLDLRLRGETVDYYQIITTMNPTDETHYIKTEYIDKGIGDFLRTTYKDNYFIDQEYVKLLEEQLIYDENLYRVYCQGVWGKVRTGGEFYSQFKYNIHVKEDVPYRTELAMHLSFDQNVVPYITGLVGQIEKIGDIYYVYFVDEFCLANPKNNTEALCKAILDIYERNITALYYYGDASGRKRDTRENINDYEIVERVFQKFIQPQSCRVPFSNPGLSNRRKFANRILAEALPIRVVINSRCKNLIKDFENVKEDADGTKYKKKKLDKATGQVYEDVGHTSDAWDYKMCAAFERYFDE